MLHYSNKIVHIILLDGRFEYDKKTNDRLGEEQWLWLDQVLSEQKNVNLTLIGTGVQILAHRLFGMESFKFENKKKLLDIIKKNKKSNVILMSGDVHYS